MRHHRSTIFLHFIPPPLTSTLYHTSPMSFLRLKPSTIAAEALRTHLATPKHQPLHVQELTAQWPASSLWTIYDGLQSLRDSVGETKEVDVELGKKGRGYLDPEYKRVSMGFGLFLDAFILDRIPSSGSTGAELPKGYLAQSDLLDSAPAAQAHCPDLEHYLSGPRGDIFRRTIWIGPSGSWTPFHKDPYIGIYNQILGHKKFHLLPPSAERLLSPSTSPRFKNTSTIPISVSSLAQLETTGYSQYDDLSRQDLDRHVKSLEEAAGLEGACEVCLGPGESVVVPEGWWHSAEGGDGPGVGVGAWFR